MDLLGGNTDVTVIVVANPAATQGSGVTMLGYGASWTHGFEVNGVNGVTNAYALQYWTDAVGYNGGNEFVNVAAGRPQMVEYVKSGQTLTGYLNGVLQSTGGVDSALAAQLAPVVLGGRWLGSNYYNGQIAEVLVYNRALSATERAQIETALTTKYNLNDSDNDGLPDDWELRNLGTLQYGPTDDPGGVGRTLQESYNQGLSPWPSATVSAGLQSWYRADLGVTKDSSNNVSQWADLSGNGVHVSQPTATAQPVWNANGAGSEPVVQFNVGAARN